MNKTELIEVVAKQTGDRRSASVAVEAVVDAITRAVADGQKVSITGFGVFEKVERAARTARNPSTGQAVPMEQTTMPKFRPGQCFRDLVSGAKPVPTTSSGRAVTARSGRVSPIGPRGASSRLPDGTPDGSPNGLSNGTAPAQRSGEEPARTSAGIVSKDPAPASSKGWSAAGSGLSAGRPGTPPRAESAR